MSATDQVLNTAELVELILLQIEDLAIAETLRAKRVNRFFCNVITNSMPLLRIAFLEPSPLGGSISNHPELEIYPDVERELFLCEIHPFVNLGDYSWCEGQEHFFLSDRPYTEAQLESVKSHLVTQPPCDKFRLYYQPIDLLKHLAAHRLRTDHVDVDGNTVGDLMAAIEELKGQGMEIACVDTKGFTDRHGGYAYDELASMAVKAREARWAAEAEEQAELRKAWTLAKARKEKQVKLAKDVKESAN